MYAIIPQSYDTTTDACQVHLVRRCTVDRKPVGESVRVRYEDDDGEQRSALVDPVIGVSKTRKAAELMAASRISDGAYRFHGERNRDVLGAATALDDAYPVGPERTAIFATA